jgi:hypothetical protein
LGICCAVQFRTQNCTLKLTTTSSSSRGSSCLLHQFSTRIDSLPSPIDHPNEWSDLLHSQHVIAGDCLAYAAVPHPRLDEGHRERVLLQYWAVRTPHHLPGQFLRAFMNIPDSAGSRLAFLSLLPLLKCVSRVLFARVIQGATAGTSWCRSISCSPQTLSDCRLSPSACSTDRHYSSPVASW